MGTLSRSRARSLLATLIRGAAARLAAQLHLCPPRGQAAGKQASRRLQPLIKLDASHLATLLLAGPAVPDCNLQREG